MALRHAELDDAASLLELHLKLDRETEFMLLEPGERSDDPGDQRKRLNGVLSRANQTFIVAESGAQLIGYIAVLGGPYSRNRHSAHLVMGVLQAHAGQGVGTSLLEEAEAWARTVGISRLELTVMSHNDRAIRLYERQGFEREGTRRRALRVAQRDVDELYMAKLVA